jgi:hypothetical protein
MTTGLLHSETVAALGLARQALDAAYGHLAEAARHEPHFARIAGLASDVDDTRREIDRVLSPPTEDSDGPLD